eukprot:350364-Chlamydomonas_euryale.AAC.3
MVAPRKQAIGHPTFMCTNGSDGSKTEYAASSFPKGVQRGRQIRGCVHKHSLSRIGLICRVAIGWNACSKGPMTMSPWNS